MRDDGGGAEGQGDESRCPGCRSPQVSLQPSGRFRGGSCEGERQELPACRAGVYAAAHLPPPDRRPENGGVKPLLTLPGWSAKPPHPGGALELASMCGALCGEETRAWTQAGLGGAGCLRARCGHEAMGGAGGGRSEALRGQDCCPLSAAGAPQAEPSQQRSLRLTGAQGDGAAGRAGKLGCRRGSRGVWARLLQWRRAAGCLRGLLGFHIEAE